mgnify:FL=1
MAWKLIAAVAQNGVIGKGLDIPWHFSEDFKHFKRSTMGGIVVMGRRTWESFKGRPLPGRENVVISSLLKAVEGVKVFKTLEEFKNAYRDDERQVWIIGGASLYESALKDCDELVITRVKLSPDGDVFFPKFEDKFKETGKIFESPDFDIVKYTVK